MKHFKTRFLALCGLMVLSAASLAPMLAEAQGCPTIVVDCPNGKFYSCSGIQNGDTCSYNASCVSGGKCGGGNGFEIVDGPVG